MSSSVPVVPTSRWSRPRPRGRTRAAALAVAAPAEELDAVGDDLDGLSLGAVLGLPLAPVQAPVDADRAALGGTAHSSPLVAPDGDVEVVRLLAPLAGGRVLLAGVDGDPELADGGAGRRVPELWVAGQVPDQDDAVDVGHGYSSSDATISASAPSCRAGADAATVSPTSLGSPHGQVAHDPVGDLEDPGDLLERLRLSRKGQQVVGAVGLVVDLVGELAATPDIVASTLPPLRSTSSRVRWTISDWRSSGSSGSSISKISYGVTARFLLPSVLGGLAVSRALAAPAGQGRKRAAV